MQIELFPVVTVDLVACNAARFDSDVTNGDPRMPRPRNPSNEAARARTERWRANRRAAGRPEASVIDRAVAAAMAVYLSQALDADPAMPQPSARDIVGGAQKLLVAAGYDRHASNAELKRRLTRRADLVSLSRITQNVSSDGNSKSALPPLLRIQESEI